MFIKANKKGVTEIVSFVLITLLIVIASSGAYFYSKGAIDDQVQTLDLKNMDFLFKNLNYKLEESKVFDGNSFSVGISFNTGEVYAKGNGLFYQSLVSFSGNNYCFDDICHKIGGNSELVYFNLTDGYEFNSNFTLVPGNYILFFKNYENESKIYVKIQ